METPHSSQILVRVITAKWKLYTCVVCRYELCPVDTK